MSSEKDVAIQKLSNFKQSFTEITNALMLATLSSNAMIIKSGYTQESIGLSKSIHQLRVSCFEILIRNYQSFKNELEEFQLDMYVKGFEEEMQKELDKAKTLKAEADKH